MDILSINVLVVGPNNWYRFPNISSLEYCCKYYYKLDFNIRNTLSTTCKTIHILVFLSMYCYLKNDNSLRNTLTKSNIDHPKSSSESFGDLGCAYIFVAGHRGIRVF